MKPIISLCFLGIILTVMNVSEATNARHKRAAAIEYCPKGTSEEQCKEYAESKSDKINYCHTYSVSNGMIQWASCGVVACGDNFKVVEEDLSKPYPECCKTCAPIGV